MTKVELFCMVLGIGFLFHGVYRISPAAAEILWALVLIGAGAPSKGKGA